MKILCLHGSYGSAAVSESGPPASPSLSQEKPQNFKVQLAPLTDALRQLGPVEFAWIDGSHSVTPPAGFDNYFGSPPFYRFIDPDGVSGLDTMVESIRELSNGATTESTMRKLWDQNQKNGSAQVEFAVNNILQYLERNPDIDGILGYSEGATLASTIVLEEIRRCEAEGRPRQIKYGVFFAGWPPIQLRSNTVQFMLADECDSVLNVPSCHVIGCNDPYVHGSMALFSLCDEDTAVLFDHGGGHTLPRDQRTIRELASTVWNICGSV
ncbi:hypothetical protein OQA88_3733 [Cercophora sp. LCS_1]